LNKTKHLLSEDREAFDRIWFVSAMDVADRTETSILVRLHIQSDIFVHAFLGESSGSLYFALIEMNQRIFGTDRESGEWHMHPYGDPHTHELPDEGLEPKPLLRFLSRVGKLIFEHNPL